MNAAHEALAPRPHERINMAKRQPLPFDEALRRTERITSLLAKDTWYALRARSALHTANDFIWDHDCDSPSEFADTYNVVQNSLALNVPLRWLACVSMFQTQTDIRSSNRTKPQFPFWRPC